MGNEAPCTVRIGGRSSAGKALLETKELLFRGDFRLSIPMAAIKNTRAVGGNLEVDFEGGHAVFELGPLAAKWDQKIRNPRGRLEKLGVKAGMKVAAIGVGDESFLTELSQRVDSVAGDASKGLFDLIFYGASDRADLARVAKLAGRLTKTGALWVVRPKGIKAITEREVMDAGKAAGLVDTKVVAFSESHTAEKFVIPVAKR